MFDVSPFVLNLSDFLFNTILFIQTQEAYLTRSGKELNLVSCGTRGTFIGDILPRRVDNPRLYRSIEINCTPVTFVNRTIL